MEKQLGVWAQAIQEYIILKMNGTYNKEEFNEKWYGKDGIVTKFTEEQKLKGN